MSDSFQRILVTGATGFLGHHLMPRLRDAFPIAQLFPAGRAQGDLRDPDQARRLLAETRPDAVVHLAALSGGIISNDQRPADYFYENTVINTHMLHESFRAGVCKFMSLIGGCSYPATATSPIGEDQIWNGFPQIQSAGYSVAKKMLLVQSWAYRKQHGFNSVIVIPGNLYGEWDNFRPAESHVIPALLRRFVEAQEQGQPRVACYGSGQPTRDFVYAGDVAAVLPWFLKHYDRSEPVNISTGRRISIRELAETVKAVTDYRGEITWDPSKPDGQMDKIFDVSRLKALGLSCETPLETGLRRTAEWFVEARRQNIVRL